MDGSHQPFTVCGFRKSHHRRVVQESTPSCRSFLVDGDSRRALVTLLHQRALRPLPRDMEFLVGTAFSFLNLRNKRLLWITRSTAEGYQGNSCTVVLNKY